MKRVVDKNGRKVTYFNSFDITKDTVSCPQCGRPFKELDVKFLNTNGRYTCSKCGSKLTLK